MKIARKTKKSKTILAITLLVVLLLGIGAYALSTRSTKESQPTDTSTTPIKNDTDTSTAVDEQTQQTEQKKDFIDNEVENEKKSQEGNVDEQAPDSTASSSVSLSAEQSGDSVTIYTQLGSTPSGICKLTVNNGGKNHAQTAEVIYQTQQSFCAGFSVPKDALGSGKWNITLTVESPSGSSQKTITKEVR